ncbi:MAG: pantetheine-phosphate adenylyltransferase [Oscillospiraceae bacterium]
MTTALIPGSFDPITLGHLNIIRRASQIFDHVVVCVMKNSAKNYLFSIDERVELARRVVDRLGNVEVTTTNMLLAEYAKQYEGAVIVKGLRAVSDFDYEFQLALVNKKMNPDLDTLFLTSSEKYTFLSSTVVKEMAAYGADLSEFAPSEIIDDIKERINQRRQTQQ